MRKLLQITSRSLPASPARGLTGLIVVACLCAMVGCTSTQPPEVEITDVALSDVTEEGYVVDFKLRLENPNRQVLDLDEIQYRFAIDGDVIYEGRRSAQAAIAPGGEVSLQVPAVVVFDRVGHQDVPSSITYGLSGTIRYFIPNQLAETLFDAAIFRPEVPFARQGSLTFNE